MPTIDERLTYLEVTINRIMEVLQEKATVEDGQDYTDVFDPTFESIRARLDKLEESTQTLLYLVRTIEKNR